jgi:hypothetical protein
MDVGVALIKNIIAPQVVDLESTLYVSLNLPLRHSRLYALEPEGFDTLTLNQLADPFAH